MTPRQQSLNRFFSRKVVAGLALFLALAILYAGSEQNAQTPSATNVGWWTAISGSMWVYALAVIGLLVALVVLALIVHSRRGRDPTTAVTTPALAQTPAPAPTPTVPVAGQASARSGNDWLRMGMVATGLVALSVLSFFLTEDGPVRYLSWAMLAVLFLLLVIFWPRLGGPTGSASSTSTPTPSTSTKASSDRRVQRMTMLDGLTIFAVLLIVLAAIWTKGQYGSFWDLLQLWKWSGKVGSGIALEYKLGPGTALAIEYTLIGALVFVTVRLWKFFIFSAVIAVIVYLGWHLWQIGLHGILVAIGEFPMRFVDSLTGFPITDTMGR